MLSKKSLLISAVAILGLTTIAAGCNKQSSTEAAMENSDSAMHSSKDVSNHSEAQGNLQVSLTQLFGQHVDLAAAATRAGFDGRSKDFDASAKALDNNSVSIAKAIGSVYGPQAESQFLAVWRSHIGFFVDYTVAAKAGDKAGMDKAVQNLTGYVDASSQFLASANPNLSQADLKTKITEHVLQLKSAVDAYGAGDIAKSYSEQDKAYTHMGMLAHDLSHAIAKQFPDKF